MTFNLVYFLLVSLNLYINLLYGLSSTGICAAIQLSSRLMEFPFTCALINGSVAAIPIG